MSDITVARGFYKDTLPLKDGTLFFDKENDEEYIKKDSSWVKLHSPYPEYKTVTYNPVAWLKAESWYLYGTKAAGKKIFLFMKEASGNDSIIGGQLIASGGTILEHYSISLACSGSRSLYGASTNGNKAVLVKVTQNNTVYYGIQFSETSEKAIYFSGFVNIGATEVVSSAIQNLTAYDKVETLTNDTQGSGNTITVDSDDIASLDDLLNGGLEETGETGTPYTIKITGTLSLTDLQTIAADLKNSQMQINLDLSAATVDNTAYQWTKSVALFQNCVSLRGIALPSGVLDLYGTTFSGCYFLTKVIFNDDLEYIYSDWSYPLFNGCNINTIVIPDSVTYLGSYFTKNSNIQNVYFKSVDNRSTLPFTEASSVFATASSSFKVYINSYWMTRFKNHWSYYNPSYIFGSDTSITSCASVFATYDPSTFDFTSLLTLS